MRYLYFLLIFTYHSGMGQTFKFNKEVPYTDTVKCIMLCADTVLYIEKPQLNIQTDGKIITCVTSYRTFTIEGYVVRKHYWESHPESVIIDEEEMTVLWVKYLDCNKNTINYTVWMAKIQRVK